MQCYVLPSSLDTEHKTLMVALYALFFCSVMASNQKKALLLLIWRGKNYTAAVDGNSRKGIFSFMQHLMENPPISLCCILSGPLDMMPRSITCSFFTSSAFKFDSSIQIVKRKFTSRHDPNVTKGSKSSFYLRRTRQRKHL